MDSHGSSDAKVFVGVNDRADGSMYVRVCQGMDSGVHCWKQNSRNLAVAQWFQLEVYYVKYYQHRTRYSLQDGTRIVDAMDVDTANSEDLQCAVVSYGTDLDPSDNMIYVDDAMISTKRIGPNRGAR
jgi:hypothetical protein